MVLARSRGNYRILKIVMGSTAIHPKRREAAIGCFDSFRAAPDHSTTAIDRSDVDCGGKTGHTLWGSGVTLLADGVYRTMLEIDLKRQVRL